MTSEKKIAANRANARKSTGPRTARGKSQAWGNALRHGLASVALRTPEMSARVERMAKLICGESTNEEQYNQAVIIAESDIVVVNVRTAKSAAFERLRIALDEQSAERVTVDTLMILITPLTAKYMEGAPTSDQWTRVFRKFANGNVFPHARALRRAARAYGKAHAAMLEEIAQTAGKHTLEAHPLEKVSVFHQEPRLPGLSLQARLALYELVKLTHYEDRALARRSRAIRKLERLRA
jgi:hypothetical protein